MIDYDKLKLAHELFSKLTDKYYLSMYVRREVEFTLCPDAQNEQDLDFDCIDLLIAKLTELTQSDEPKPKYEVGQQVWYFWNHDVVNTLVERVVVNEEINYVVECGRVSMPESLTFPSREALIDAQIEYWQNLLRRDNHILDCSLCGQPSLHIFEIPKECHHESDGTIHAMANPGETGRLLMNKCKLCGEFYRW